MALKKNNHFFYNNSKSWAWPLKTNSTYQTTFGETFEEVLAGFNQQVLDDSAKFNVLQGEQIARSKSYAFMNNDVDEIYFLTSDTQTSPELVKINKSDLSMTSEHDSYLLSKVIKTTKGDYTTQAGHFVNPTRISQGLFDSDGYIEEGTQGRMIQGYLNDETPVYFDVVSSFSEPQLYVGAAFYGEVNSSVYIDDADNLYYFVRNTAPCIKTNKRLQRLKAITVL